MKKLQVGETCWIKHKDNSYCYFRFKLINNNTVYVHGTESLVYYVDKEMPIQEAREFYREKIKNNYHKIKNTDAPRMWWFWN